MRVAIAMSLIGIQSQAFSLTSDEGSSAVDTALDAITSGAISSPATPQEYAPMSARERAHRYLVGAFGSGAILRAASAAGISQWIKTPKEWGAGAAAYGDRIGNAFAEHVIREALEYGASTALHEDNRPIRLWFLWSGCRDLNPGPLAPQASAL